MVSMVLLTRFCLLKCAAEEQSRSTCCSLHRKFTPWSVKFLVGESEVFLRIQHNLCTMDVNRLFASIIMYADSYSGVLILW